MSDSKSPADDKIIEPTEPVMSKEDIAYFIRTMWSSLLIPKWERLVLIDLGTAVHAKTPLSKLDQKKLNELLPHLSVVAENFGKTVSTKFSTEYNAYLKAQEKAHLAALAAITGTPPANPSEAPADDSALAMSKEDIAYFIRAIWSALLIPNWERADLIDLGMAIFTKTTLAKMEQKKLGKLLPYLSTVAEHFGKQVRLKFSSEYDAFLKAVEASQQSELAIAKEAAATIAQEVSPASEPPIEPPIEQPVEQAVEPAIEQTSEQATEQTSEQTAEQPPVEPQGETNG
jgi:hypothetical protein